MWRKDEGVSTRLRVAVCVTLPRCYCPWVFKINSAHSCKQQVRRRGKEGGGVELRGAVCHVGDVLLLVVV